MGAIDGAGRNLAQKLGFWSGHAHFLRHTDPEVSSSLVSFWHPKADFLRACSSNQITWMLPTSRIYQVMTRTATDMPEKDWGLRAARLLIILSGHLSRARKSGAVTICRQLRQILAFRPIRVYPHLSAFLMQTWKNLCPPCPVIKRSAVLTCSLFAHGSRGSVAPAQSHGLFRGISQHFIKQLRCLWQLAYQEQTPRSPENWHTTPGVSVILRTHKLLTHHDSH